MSVGVARAAAPRLMRDTCTISTPGTPVDDDTGGSTPGTPTTITSRCRLQDNRGSANWTAEREQMVGRYTLYLPFDTPIALNATVSLATQFDTRSFRVAYLPPVVADTAVRKVGLDEYTSSPR